MVRIAVLGLGRMGRFYAHALASLGPAVELSAVADPDAAARATVAAEIGVPASADPGAVIDGGHLDAVVIATPTSTHAALVIAAARAGMAIFCEKPLALSLDDTRAVLRRTAEAGVSLQVGFMRRFDVAYRQARAAIAAGQIGTITTFKAVGRDPVCPPLDYVPHSGGLIVDMAIHDFDLARWLVQSEVERVVAEGTALACAGLAELGDMDNAIITLRFASGAIGAVEVSRNARYGYDVRTELLGTNGGVMIGDPPPAGGLTSPPVEDATPHFIRRFGDAYRTQIEYFVDCVRERRDPEPGGRDALAAFEIAHAATIAYREARPVALSEIRDVARV